MINWIASALTLLGNIVLIKHKSWKAFVIFFVGNSLWAYHWLEKKEWAALLLVIIFIGTNIWGIISWRKNENWHP